MNSAERKEQALAWWIKHKEQRIKAWTDKANLYEICAIYAIAWLFGWTVSPWFIIAWLAFSCLLHVAISKASAKIATDIAVGRYTPTHKIKPREVI